MKYRKKPVVVEAFKVGDEAPIWFIKAYNRGLAYRNEVYYNEYGSLTIKTIEGDMKASLGDWIIQGVDGEIYPCKPDIFEKTYELLGEG